MDSHRVNPDTPRLAHSALFQRAFDAGVADQPTFEVHADQDIVTVTLGENTADIDYDADWYADGVGVSSELAVALFEHDLPQWLIEWCDGADEARCLVCTTVRDYLLADVAERRAEGAAW